MNGGDEACPISTVRSASKAWMETDTNLVRVAMGICTTTGHIRTVSGIGRTIDIDRSEDSIHMVTMGGWEAVGNRIMRRR